MITQIRAAWNSRDYFRPLESRCTFASFALRPPSALSRRPSPEPLFAVLRRLLLHLSPLPCSSSAYQSTPSCPALQPLPHPPYPPPLPPLIPQLTPRRGAVKLRLRSGVSPILDFLGAFVAISATLRPWFSLVRRLVRL